MKGQDLVLLIDLVVSPEDREASFAVLAERLHLSSSQVHAANKRLVRAQLLDAHRQPRPHDLREFLLHGFRFLFPAEVSGLALGMPTAWSAAPMKDLVASSDVVVWPTPAGDVQGHAIEPIHRIVPELAAERPELHEMLALLDCLRIGRLREKRLAAEEIERRLAHA